MAKYNGPQAYLHDRRSCLGSVTRDTLDLIRKADRIMEYSEPRLVRIPHDSDEYSPDYRERDKAIAEIQNLLAAVDGRLSYGPTGVPLDALVTEDAYSGVELLDTHPCYSLRPAGTYLGA